MGIELIRFDMSEYMERHTVSRLLGAPPGYVGFDQGGLLTDAIDQHPHAVLLLDEIEKAHPDLFNILLQVMDHGKLTDHNGKAVDFRNVILIMTTNAGASMMAKSAIGFMRDKREGEDQAEIERLFAPEFRNRLDAIIPFSNLPAGDRGAGGRQVRHAAGGPARRPPRQHRALGCGAEVAGRDRLRSALWRAAAGPHDPGAHQEAARRGAAVRQAREGRYRPRRFRPGQATKLTFEIVESKSSPARRDGRTRRRVRNQSAGSANPVSQILPSTSAPGLLGSGAESSRRGQAMNDQSEDHPSRKLCATSTASRYRLRW